MSSLLSKCEELFGTDDAYKLFEVTKTVTPAQLKKAFYKISLRVHPDKVSEKERAKATEKFQLLSAVFKLLSDKKTRSIYDKTGELETEDELLLSEDFDVWMEYWRELFPVVNNKDIEDFHAKYKGSSEELSDLKKAYLNRKGDMEQILATVLCATYEDEDRFRSILMPLIESKELPSYKKFTHESAASKKKRLNEAKKEAAEAKKAEKERKAGTSQSLADLQLAIKRNRDKRGGILSYLEEKYANMENDSEIDMSEGKSPQRAKGKKPAKRSNQTKPRGKQSTEPAAKRQKVA